MDRFIDNKIVQYELSDLNLKSNMDRFIVNHQLLKGKSQFHLKSNMDRFIVSSIQSDILGYII